MPRLDTIQNDVSDPMEFCRFKVYIDVKTVFCDITKFTRNKKSSLHIFLPFTLLRLAYQKPRAKHSPVRIMTFMKSSHLIMYYLVPLTTIYQENAIISKDL